MLVHPAGRREATLEVLEGHPRNERGLPLLVPAIGQGSRRAGRHDAEPFERGGVDELRDHNRQEPVGGDAHPAQQHRELGRQMRRQWLEIG